MPVVCDFVQIVGDGPVTIGDSNHVWEKPFNTGGRNTSYTALLIFNIRGLTYATDAVDVKINNRVVGQIAPYRGLSNAERDNTAKHWYTQMIAMNGSELNSGDNEIQIEAVGYPEATGSNKFDDFQIKNMVCFFHQSAG